MTRRIALLNPLGDFGISMHTHELANALTTLGMRVDVYGNGAHLLDGFDKRYGFFPILGSSWVRRAVRQARSQRKGDGDTSASPTLPVGEATGQDRTSLRHTVRDVVLAGELAVGLRLRGYDLVWTQWPTIYQTGVFWRLASMLGLRMVHSVHNVLPHEVRAGDERRCATVYRLSERLVVHSRYAKAALAAAFPGAEQRAIVAPLGAYTVYPRRPADRDRVRAKLGVTDAEPVILLFGLQRPYKNPDAVVEAVARVRHLNPVLLVAGREVHFPDADPSDPLARVRRQARMLGIADRVRLLPGLPSHDDLPSLLEAADIVPLPYLESYGSAQLLLARQFGKIVMATAVGGMDEYLEGATDAVLLEGPGTDHVAQGLSEAINLFHEHQTRGGRNTACLEREMQRFDWQRIAASILAELALL